MLATSDNATAPMEMITLFRKNNGKSGREDEYSPAWFPRASAA